MNSSNKNTCKLCHRQLLGKFLSICMYFWRQRTVQKIDTSGKRIYDYNWHCVHIPAPFIACILFLLCVWENVPPLTCVQGWQIYEISTEIKFTSNRGESSVSREKISLLSKDFFFCFFPESWTVAETVERMVEVAPRVNYQCHPREDRSLAAHRMDNYFLR